MEKYTMEVHLDRDTQQRLDDLAHMIARSQGELAAQLLKISLNDLQAWQIDAIQQGLAEADAGTLTELAQVRQHWEDKRARHTDAQR
jgi:predicted transcriptional regulator